MLKTKRKGKRNLKKNINNYKIGGNSKKKVTHKKHVGGVSRDMLDRRDDEWKAYEWDQKRKDKKEKAEERDRAIGGRGDRKASLWERYIGKDKKLVERQKRLDAEEAAAAEEAALEKDRYDAARAVAEAQKADKKRAADKAECEAYAKMSPEKREAYDNMKEDEERKIREYEEAEEAHWRQYIADH